MTSDESDERDLPPLLQVDQIRTYYAARGAGRRSGKAWVRAVDDVSFSIKKGETFGLVGESGCGKTTLGRTVARLIEPQSGQILFNGQDILKAQGSALRKLRREIQVVFQDSFGTLNPRMRVGEIIGEGLVIQAIMDRKARKARVVQLADAVGIRSQQLTRLPHEFSGGQRQRIGIARALAVEPSLVIADEPVSALDVSIQSQILNLLSDLQKQFDLTYLFIAHDLSVVEYVSDRIGVMYLGKLVELASSEELYADPRMPYTQALFSAIPSAESEGRRRRIVLKGDPPSPVDPPSGCRFRTRCWMAKDVCAQEVPPLREIRPDHWVSCHFAENTSGKQHQWEDNRQLAQPGASGGQQ